MTGLPADLPCPRCGDLYDAAEPHTAACAPHTLSGQPRRRPGRKPISDDTVLLQVKLSREDRDLYQAVAVAAGVTIADVVRDHLRRWARARSRTANSG